MFTLTLSYILYINIKLKLLLDPVFSQMQLVQKSQSNVAVRKFYNFDENESK